MTVITVPADLAASGARLLAAVEAGRVEPSALAEATGMRMIAVSTLAPAPRDPVEHLRAAHATARGHLERLAAHDPAVEVLSTMTTALFRRLTRKPGEPPAPPVASRPYTYTPRKVLRRVLDHALDHLTQVDQWLAWQHEGVVPVPTDGWASSVVTLPEDRLPLGATTALTDAEMDWPPPDAGWPLRRVLHHVARSEVAYAGALDDALPDDARVRYAEANRRLTRRLVETRDHAADASIVFVNGYGTLCTPDGVVDDVLGVDRELLGREA